MLASKDENLRLAMKELKKYVDFDFSCVVEVENIRENGYKIIQKENGLRIEYSKRHTLFMALKEIMLGATNVEKNLKVERVGLMFDCARNAVMTVETAKRFVVYLALFGYNYMQLYLEDCLKVEGEEYFGYMRGAYSKEEIKEIDSFALLFGIELVPCIQTLAHYNQLFWHSEYQKVRDNADILLIGAERTYQLIDNIFRTVSECFTTKNINIGMDEAESVGRGRYCDLNGYKNKSELIFAHLEKVLALCKKYGFEPYMWSDMLFKNYFGKYYVSDVEFSQEYISAIPQGVNYVYWDYYHANKASYQGMMKLHKQISSKLCFAGGIWTWRGFAPYNEYTELTMFPALEAAIEEGATDVSFTMWGDNGGECSRFSVLSSMLVVAEKLYNGTVDYLSVSKIVETLTGYTYDEFKKLDLPNQLSGKPIDTNTNPCKYLLYSDPLVALFDAYIQDGYENIYKDYAEQLEKLSNRKSNYAYIFDTLSKLCKALSYKAELSVKLKKAYDENDKEWLAALVVRIDNAINAIQDFYKSFKYQWAKENKSFGFEISDIRLGGLMLRLAHLKEIINDYVNGKIEKIEELEEERRSFQREKTPNEVSIMYNNYRETVTTGGL